MTAGSIYDIGYRGYDGPRLGRSHAVAALIRHSMRSILGIGRSGRAKVIPAFCLGLPALVALIIVGVRALAQGATGGELGDIGVLPGHSGMYQQVAVFPILFVAAQAPELLGRDQRYRVLTLYFSRALRRPDYALAKLAALSLGVMSILLLPQLILAVGSVLLTTDTVEAIRTELGALPAILGSSVIIAIVTSGLALVVASITPRRAYATAAIFGVFIIPAIVAAIVLGLDVGEASKWIVLIDVGTLLDGINAWFFGVAPSGPGATDVPIEALAGGAVLLGVGCSAALVWRYVRIQV
jgi:ABC-2 type transport system permease protein